MPSQVLKNILTFVGLAPGVPTSQPHKLARGGNAEKPNVLALSATGYTLAVDEVNVTLTRTTGPANVEVYVELWHSIEDSEPLPNGINPALFPFVIQPGGGGGGGGAVVADGITITGDGTLGNPLAVIPAGLAGQVPVVSDGVTITGDGTAGFPLVANIPPDTGITQLINDVQAGPGSGVQGSTVVALRNRTIANIAPVNGQALIWNGGTNQWTPTGLPPDTGITQLTSDVAAGPGSGSQAATVVALQGNPVSNVAPANGQALIWNGGTSQWEPTAPIDTGITQLTGDTLAGPGNGSQPSTVVALQGNPVAAVSPANGQVLTWNGSSWVPGSVPTGGSGGGGIVYYLNEGTAPDAPTTNIPLSTNGLVSVKELGTVAEVPQTSVTSSALSTVAYDLICGFVTDLNVPGQTAIPAGLWDFNIWISSNAGAANQAILQLQVYTYDGVNAPTLIATSNDSTIYDPSAVVQYAASVIVPQTVILATDRIYVEVRGKATVGGVTITAWFGDATPTHVHTTLPSVAGTGIVHVVNGAFVSPAAPVGLGTADVSGILPVANGGTGTSTVPTNGQILIGNGTGYAVANLTAGSNVSITNGAGSITIASTDTGITQLTGDVTAGPGSGSQAATVVRLQNRDVAATAPTAGQVLAWNNGTSQWEPVTPTVGTVTAVTASSPLSSSGGATPNISLAVAMSGDLTGNYPAPTVAKIQNRTVSAAVPVNGEVLTWNGGLSQWEPDSLPPNYWQRTGTVLSPATVNDSVAISSTSLPALAVTGLGPTIYVSDAVDGQFFEINSSLYQATWTDPTGPTNVAIVDPYEVVVSDGANLNAHVEADKFFVTDNAITTTVTMGMLAGTATIATTDGAVQTALNLDVLDLQIQGASGNTGEVLTSQGAGAAPIWSALTVPAVIFDDAVAGTNVNIRSDRAANQSPIDNTKAQITNFGSQDGTVDPGATGATADAATIGGGNDNTASNTAATVVGGAGNTASGAWATVAGGFSNVASGNTSFATNSSNVASGDASFAAGDLTIASGTRAVTFGLSTQASGLSAFATGNLTDAQADNSHAEGTGSIVHAAAAAGHAEGISAEVFGQGGHAEGANSHAVGQYSHAQGLFSKALRDTQSSHASGSSLSPFGGTEYDQRSPQTSLIVMRGVTGGLGINESVELIYADSSSGIELEDSTVYNFKIVAVVGGTQAGPTYGSRSFELAFTARRMAGTTTIVATGPSAAYGDAASATWTLVASVGAAPDRIVLTFDTGAGAASACYVTARVEFVEYRFAA